MNSYDQSTAWLHNSPLAPYIDAYKQHFIQESYSPKTSKAYFHYVAHFAYWMTQTNLNIHHVNETTIQEFINGCQSNCASISYTEKCMHAALIHLINILVEEGVSIYPDKKPTLVDEELQAFDDYMNHVKGLAPKTRHQYLYITERLLCEKFSTGAVVISEIMPEDVRQFINHQKELYTTFYCGV
ncbi:MAG: hypothetical protein KZQ83_06690 [gamma proteobacterium symbiont of Taylorina sp.]|nr:hypothetical protein [gamma proteobacterium symbiont of Taylorina sp.]